MDVFVDGKVTPKNEGKGQWEVRHPKYAVKEHYRPKIGVYAIHLALLIVRCGRQSKEDSEYW
jgi:hypothetical protein